MTLLIMSAMSKRWTTLLSQPRCRLRTVLEHPLVFFVMIRSYLWSHMSTNGLAMTPLSWAVVSSSPSSATLLHVLPILQRARPSWNNSGVAVCAIHPLPNQPTTHTTHGATHPWPNQPNVDHKLVLLNCCHMHATGTLFHVDMVNVFNMA